MKVASQELKALEKFGLRVGFDQELCELV